MNDEAEFISHSSENALLVGLDASIIKFCKSLYVIGLINASSVIKYKEAYFTLQSLARKYLHSLANPAAICSLLECSLLQEAKSFYADYLLLGLCWKTCLR